LSEPRPPPGIALASIMFAALIFWAVVLAIWFL
jgi:hypothetical protein